MNKVYDVIIIGSGPTGLYGAFFGCLKKLNILIMEINSTYGGAPSRLYPDKPLYDIPGHEVISGAQLVENMYKQLCTRDGWEIQYNTKVTEIQKKANSNIFTLLTSDNTSYQTKNIVFATGYGAFEFINFTIPVHNKAKDKIHNYVVNSNDYKNKHVVICGGGDSAVDYGNLLKDKASKVTMIHRRNEFRAKAANVETLGSKVDLKLNYLVTEVKEDKIVIQHNENGNIEEIPFDEILVMYGTCPVQNNIKLANLFNKALKIEVDEHCESKEYKNIYACGLATQNKQELTIITGIADIIRVMSKIEKELNSK